MFTARKHKGEQQREAQAWPNPVTTNSPLWFHHFLCFQIFISGKVPALNLVTVPLELRWRPKPVAPHGSNDEFGVVNCFVRHTDL